MPRRISTNASPCFGIVRIIANSRVICRYPVVVVWNVLVILEVQHLLGHIVAKLHDLFANVI